MEVDLLLVMSHPMCESSAPRGISDHQSNLVAEAVVQGDFFGGPV